MSGTTPVPNVLFDIFLKELKSAELKVLLVIIRQTLGWSDKIGARGRKEMDWISSGQLRTKTGSSRRAISSAIEVLVSKELIVVLDRHGNLLNDPLKRQGKPKLFFRPSLLLFPPVENEGISSGNLTKNSTTSANIAQHFSKKITSLAQKKNITKETQQN
jgi:hypothetical protein